MTENQTDRLQQLEDVMNELQSLRTGTNVKSMIVVQSDEPNHEIIPPVPAPTVSPFSSRLTVGIGLAIVLFIFGALMVRQWQASPMTRLDQLKAATQQAATGDLNQALASVETLTDADCSPAELITAAAAFATASTKTTDDRALAEHRAARAVL